MSRSPDSMTTNPWAPPPPLLTRTSALTGSQSGSASPSTRYGSFPPGEGTTPAATRLADSAVASTSQSPAFANEVGFEHHAKQTLEGILHSKLSSESIRANRNQTWPRRKRRRGQNSRERLLKPSLLGNDLAENDSFESEEGESDGDDEIGNTTESIWNAGDEEALQSAAGGLHSNLKGKKRQIESESGPDPKQWGIMKMELMARNRDKGGLFAIYAGVYLISILMSLESNTTPTIEPYFLSMLGSHSMLSSVVIITSISFAVGKPPMTKILDVFGRAEGVAIAALIYSVGYILTAAASSPLIFMIARALAALGAQGLQLAQQIIVADTTNLSNRGLITSTISLPWLLTTWIGPPLGAWFQRRGTLGYRLAYAVFGVLLPAVSAILFCTLMMEWRKVKQRAARAGRTPSTLFGWADKQNSDSAVDGSEGGVAGIQSTSRPRSRSSGLLEGMHQELLRTRQRRNRLSAKMKFYQVWKDLDILGLITLTLGCGFFLLPFTLAAERPESWKDPYIWTFVVTGIFFLAFFVYYERVWSRVPVLPPRLLQNRTILAGSSLGFFHFLSQFFYSSFFTSFLQVARGYSPQDASYISESYIFAACFAALFAGWLAKTFNRYKFIGIAGVIIHLLGVWLMASARGLNSSTFQLVVSQALGGIGGGFTTIAGQIGCQAVVSHNDLGIATAIFLTITQIGGAVGGAGAGAIWSTILPRALRETLPAETNNPETIKKILGSLPFAISFAAGDPTRTAINLSYVRVQNVLNWMAIAALVPAFYSVCKMKNCDLKQEEQAHGEGVTVFGTASISAAQGEAGESETSSLLGGEISA